LCLSHLGPALALLLALIGCSGDDDSGPPPDYRDPSVDIELRVQLLMDEMTLREKVDEMSAPRISLGDLLLLLVAPRDIGANERLGIPALRLAGSSRGAIVYGTAFPVSMARGSSWNLALEERVGDALGAELKAVGGNVLLAPTINLLRHPGWGRAQETYGEDPHHLSRFSVASVLGIQRHVMAQVKHFALNSIEDDRGNIDVLADERTLREVYLPHFKAAVQEAGAASIMSSYNRVNGQYMGENEHLLRHILKGDWAFKGFVASDWYSGTRSTVNAAMNGLDIEMPFEQFYGERLYQAVLRGALAEDVIDDAVRRILRMKFRFGLFEEAPEIDLGVIQNPEHIQLAHEVAREGMVLLKNQGAALPLVRNELERIAVVGPLADEPRLGDLGSSTVFPCYAISPLQGLRNRAENVEVLSYTGLDPREASDLARRADAVVVVAALTALDEGEQNTPFPPHGGDRTDLALPPEDVELIQAVAAVHSRVVVVIEAGGAITVEPWIDEVQALVMAWYPGQEGGHAIAEVLFGDVNPSGKLPFTVPHADDPLYEFGSGRASIRYGYDHGYRYFDREGLQPRFPFGFGLSYTVFSYANLRLSDSSVRPDETLRVSFEVTNTGGVAGREIVQLYVAYPDSLVTRPVRELKAFDKVSIGPGETRDVTLDLRARDLAYFDEQRGRWQVEKGAYILEVGPSSRERPLTDRFTVE
jgi:beta-glucosidase